MTPQPMNTVRAAAEPIDAGDPQPALVTVPNVELLEVGEEWETSTGSFTFTMEDLASCITSQEDPSLRTPVIKLGHVDPRFDGQPSLGRIINMRLTNNDQTLVGDLAAMPLWLAQVMYTAYPRRSIEGQMQFTTRTGNTWPMILTGVALLGDAYPAIDTLEDIQALWGATPPPLYPAEDVDEIFASGSFFKARKVVDVPNWLKKKEVVQASSQVKASVSLDSVRRAFYEENDGPGQMWWWIREVRVNPLVLIVDDDEGGLFEVPVTVGADDSITFGESKAVKVEYVAASGEPVAATTAGQVVAATHTTPEETGRTSRPDPEEAATVASSTPNTNQQEILLMLTDEALKRLGLEPGATSEEISAAIVAQGVVGDPDPDPAVETDPTPEAVTVPEGMVLVDAATLAEMRNGIAAATGLVERQAKADRDAILDGAIRAGKFPLGRRAHYEALLSADAEGTKALIGSLEPGIIPVSETGEQGSSVAAAADQTAYPSGWARSVAAGRRSSSDRVKVVQD